NEIENLSSHNKDTFLLPDMLFFRPLYVLAICRGKLHIYSRTALSPQTLLSKIADTSVTKKEKETIAANIQAAMPRNYYLQSVEAIRNHIIDGDIYEMNFCQEFFVENFTVDPLLLHRRLLKKSKAPFSAFFRQRDIYLSCASPERFLQKQGRQLISQPIKGTIARGTNSTEDKKLQTQLYHSEKDRAENVMIVDLVRNDLARSSIPGTVKVDELFGIYPFAHVSHLISTVTATLRDEVHFAEALQNAFPMGSMTGAPKVMSMQLIEQYEKSKRGLYSGALGYITPDGDFDFNVVIRSILYHTTKKYLSFQVGGAIVYDSFPEKEYEECLLKAKAMLEVTTSPLNGA
ncbi:MAG TPA: anthranilate synthase component I family protein, partial [Phaeodactylibacter sp.]|nr:anthranilate synthase component I family protein [Phaeodactylibacter sp.]